MKDKIKKLANQWLLTAYSKNDDDKLGLARMFETDSYVYEKCAKELLTLVEEFPKTALDEKNAPCNCIGKGSVLTSTHKLLCAGCGKRLDVYSKK